MRGTAILLKRQGGCWMAYHHGDRAAELVELFGTTESPRLSPTKQSRKPSGPRSSGSIPKRLSVSPSHDRR